LTYTKSGLNFLVRVGGLRSCRRGFNRRVRKGVANSDFVLRTPTKETGFLLNLSSVTQYFRKNPVSEILINDCARARHENARARRENARDRRENARARHENARVLRENDCARAAPKPNSD